MGPGRAVLQGALLSFLAVAIRDGLKSESLTVDTEGDDCKQEAQDMWKLMQQLGYQGRLDGHHCEWPGVTCENRCVKQLRCETCGGRLPERINLNHLFFVKLTSPNLTGDTKAFQETPHLRLLSLHGTRIHGNLSALANLSLRYLDLSGTAVTGSLKDFVGETVAFSFLVQTLDGLRHLLLSRTKVTGDFNALTVLRKLIAVDLSHTAVAGRITSKWRGKLRHLEILKLQNTSVQFAPQGEELQKLKVHSRYTLKDERVLRWLKELDLSNCPINSPVEDLLLPLAMSGQLTSIQAGGTGIYGEISKLTDTEARIDGENVSNFTFPLAKSLVTLDLSANNVTGVHGLPVQGRMLLRENHQLNVDVKVLTEALGKQVFLDLSGTALSNQDEAAELLKEGVMKTTHMHAFRDETAGHACKDVIGTLKVTPSKFLPQELCKCLPGWFGSGATCEMCPSNKFSDDLGFDTCKSCPANSTAPAGSTKMSDCKCKFGDLHEGICACDTHHALQKGDCALCTKLHLQCETPGSLASTAVPDMDYTRLEPSADEAHKCLPPAASDRCPGSHQCGPGYNGTLCSSCADGFWATRGKCEPCAEASSTSIASHVLLGVAALLAAAFLVYRQIYGQQVPEAASVKTLLQKLLARQGPVVLQLVQLWSVLSRLGQQNSSSAKGLPEIPYLEFLQLTTTELQSSLNVECSFHAETVRTVAAISSPLAPLLVLGCCAALELYRAGSGVNMALKTLTFLYIGGASSTAQLFSCRSEDGDGASLGKFAFRKAVRHLSCFQRDGVAFWVDVVAYSTAVAYVVVIPLFLVGLMLRQHFALQDARLFTACAERKPPHTTLHLEMLDDQLSKEAFPKRLLAAVAAHMAVHCRGARQFQLLEKSATIIEISENQGEEAESDMMKAVADATASRKIDVLRGRRLTEMLTEQIMLQETQDRWLIGSRPLLSKYALCQEMWMDVAMKLFAVALVSCVSMADAWKWAIAFSLGMAVLVATCQPYMEPQVTQLQSLSCFCLALASAAFVYDWGWLARLTLVTPMLLMLWQVRCPDCTEALAERLFQELQSELPKLQRGEHCELLVQQIRF